MSSIKLLKRAKVELRDACAWYERQQKGLSERFLNEVENSFEKIISNPERYPKKYNTILHFAPVKKFPYLIIYRYDEELDKIVITSIFHTKGDSGKFEFE